MNGSYINTEYMVDTINVKLGPIVNIWVCQVVCTDVCI